MKKNLLIILLIVGLGIGTVLPFFQHRFFNVHDNTQVARVYEMGIALSNGSFPVRWVPDLGYGYGYPIFNFYGPFPYYIGGVAYIIGITSLIATKIMFVLGILVSGISMFFFSKKWFGSKAGIVSAILYLYFPYHAVNIYVRGAVGEFFAYAFLPLIFLGIFNLFENSFEKEHKKSFPTILLLSFGVLLTSISHNLSILMTLLLLVPSAVIMLVLAKRRIHFTTILLVGLLLGFLMSAFYILPAFLEKDFTNVSSQIGGGADFRNHFVCLQQYWSSQWGFGGSTSGCLDGLSFALGKLNILVLLASIGMLIVSVKQKRLDMQEKIALISLFILVCAITMTLSISSPIWNSLSLLSYVQYPWRFINFVGLFISFISGYLIYRVDMWKKNVGVVLCFTIILLAIVSSVSLFAPQNTTDLPSAYYEDKKYLTFEVSKISDEYLPSGFAVPQTISQVPSTKIEILKTAGTTNVEINKPTYTKATYAVDQDGVFHVNTAYFPGWRAFINGKQAPIVPTVNGMNVSVTKGAGVLELKLQQTPIEILGNMLSVLAFLILFTGIIRYYGKAIT